MSLWWIVVAVVCLLLLDGTLMVSVREAWRIVRDRRRAKKAKK